MKYLPFALTIIVIAAIGCVDQEKKAGEKVTNQTDTANSANHHASSASDHTSGKAGLSYSSPKFDDGMAQSPINILSTNAAQDSKLNVVTDFNDEITSIENLGHTIQLNFAEGSSATIDGKVYKFKQLHFHTPSEHLIDGVTYPMEMHVVTVSKDQKDSASYFVVGILFKMGHENKFIKEFLNAVPTEVNKKQNVNPGVIKLRDLYAGISKKELTPSFHYKGSLTTPPYSESVGWIIKKYIFEVSPEQLAAIVKIEGDNARHIRALNDRKVESN